MKKDLCQWKDISGKFQNGLILGNGASIAIDESFSYKSLLDIANSKELITPRLQKIFDYLKTEDFELVLRMLWHAFYINKALEIEDDETIKAYKEIKEGLIQSVKKIHISYDKAKRYLDKIYLYLKNFSTVACLNYDLLTYWAILYGNETLNKQWFKDCFIKGKLETDWDYLRKPHGDAEGSTLIFYPHGNLVLANDIFGSEIKLGKAEYSNLLETISDAWERSDYTPVFVSEGTEKQKQRSISRSQYLTNVYENVLTGLGETIVFYGWSLNDQDNHILKKISESKDIKAIAISVLNNKESLDKINRLVDKMKEYFPNKVDIIYYDAKSEGCWIY